MTATPLRATGKDVGCVMHDMRHDQPLIFSESTIRGKVAVAAVGETIYWKHGRSPHAEFRPSSLSGLSSSPGASTAWDTLMAAAPDGHANDNTRPETIERRAVMLPDTRRNAAPPD